MPLDLDHIKRVQDLRDHDIQAAVATRDGTRALLARLVSVSAPETGVAKVLLVLARMATMTCDWIDGDMTVDLVDEGAVTRVEVSTEMGGGLRERVFAPLRLAAPLAEFTRAIERVPHMIKPLTVRSRGEQRLSFAAAPHVGRTMPPPVEIASESLYVHVPAAVVLKETAAQALPVTAPAMPDPAYESDIDKGWD